MSNKPDEEFEPEFDIDQPEMSRRSVLAGTAGLGLISIYSPDDAPDNANPPKGSPITIGSRLELFVDDFLIDEMDSVKQRLHHPQPQEVSIEFDEPWEGDGSNYVTAFWDDELEIYRMYYRGLSIGQTQYTCYAESEDGIHWEKPSLGLIEHDGSTDNNIVFDQQPDAHNLTPFKDPNPNAEPDAKYKAVGGTGELYAHKSPDGIHWERITDDRILVGQGAFDSQNLAFWDPVRGEYRAYFRYFDTFETSDREGQSKRAIKTARSDDFVNWEEVTELGYPDAPEEQLYINGINPYYRAPHIFLGFPGRYHERDWDSRSMELLPGYPERLERVNRFSLRQGSAVSDTIFMSSRDTKTFRRWNETFHRPGLWKNDTVNAWTYATSWMAVAPVETPSPVPERPNEISMYAIENYWHPSPQMRRYSMRIDGFVSMRAPLSGGEFVTNPVKFDGDKLVLNYATSAGGTIRVELQNPAGKPIEDFTLDDSPEIFGDDLERTVEWHGDRDLEDLKDEDDEYPPVRLRFVMSDADLFSFRFRDEKADVDVPEEPIDPLAHYPFDEIQVEETFTDASLNQNDANNNGAVIDDGIIDDAIRLDTDDTWVDTPTLSLDEAVSVAGWINTEAVSDSHFIVTGADEDGKFVLYLFEDAPTWWLNTDDGPEVARNPSISTGEWVHLAGTYDGDQLRLYVDGEPVDTVSVDAEDILEPVPCRVGADSRLGFEGDFQFDGRVDDLWLFDRALDDSEVESLYDGTGDPADPIAYYPFDEIQVGEETFADASTNRNFATNNGATIDDGILDDAIRLERDDTWVDSPKLPFDDEISVSCWVNPEYDQTSFVFQGIDEAQMVVLYLAGDNTPTWWMATGEDWGEDFELARGPQIPSNQWTHLAGTYDGDTLRLYINGELTAIQTVDEDDLLSSAPVRIGDDARPDVDAELEFDGRIDDMWVFGRELADTEVEYLSQRPDR